MKHTFSLLVAVMMVATMAAQPIRVLSNQKLGEGFSPRFSADGTTIEYLESETDQYAAPVADPVLSVSNQDLKLLLTRNGQTRQLTPAGDVAYVWSTLSPDQSKIVYTTKFGTAVCDLSGRELINLGHLNAPQWMGNDHIVGMYEESDGHYYTAAAIAIRSIDGTLNQVLTDKEEIGMYPVVHEATGRIAYETLNGDIRMLQTNLTDQPIQTALPMLKKAPQRAIRRMTSATVTPGTLQPNQVRIYINPGHGGYTGNDRGMYIYPFERGSREQFWESKSNLQKGLILRDILRDLGYNVQMSRADVPVEPRTNENYYTVSTENNPEEDDLDLSVIVAQANTYDAHFMLSIHSNAGGPSNYSLMLYSGKDANDTHSYADYNLKDNESRAVSTIIGRNIMSNQNATWGPRTEPWVIGDKTFARTIMGWSNGYGVLRYLRVPGLISEGRMHDYYPETYRMMNMDYQRDEAWAFARAFNEYFCNIEFDYGAIAGQVRDWYQNWEFPDIAKRSGSRDTKQPIMGAMVELLQNGTPIDTTYTDDIYNGVFYFWNRTPGEYSVRVTAEHYYSMEKNYTVVANQVSYNDFMLNQKRETRPEVLSYFPHPAAITDSVDVATTIALNFNWDMWEEKTTPAFSISPAVAGTVTYEDSHRTLRFTPAHAFEKGTEYTVTLAASAAHPDTTFANTMAADFSFKFRTKNRDAIRIKMQYPESGAVDVPLNPSFLFILDEEVTSTSARNAFTLKDAAGSTVALNTRSMACNKLASPFGSITFETTNALAPSTTYTLTMSKNLQDKIGVYLNQDVAISFTTQAEENVALPLVDKLDTLQFLFDADKSVFVSNGSTLKNTNKKYSGTASNELSYTFSEASSDAVAYFSMKNPMLVQATANDTVGMYVFSDLCQNEVELVWNSEGDVKYTPLCTLDYGGWKWQTADMSELPAGVTYQLMAVRVKRGTSILSGSGKVYINDLSFKAGISTDVEDIQMENNAKKMIKDNQVIIIRNGIRYNALGQVIE